MAKILVIDDKRDNLIAISALLPHLIPECRVITAQSGPEGMEKAKDLLPDTILLDIKMPGMDGFEVCERLKSDRATKHIPILMLTAIKTDPKSRIKGLELGADAFLSKPIDEAEMAAQVKVMLRIKKAEDLLREKKDRLETLVRDRTKALRESEEKYRSIFETAANLITSVDRHGVIIDCNNRIENFLGYTKDEIIGQSMKFLIHPDDHGKAEEASKEVLSKGFSHNKECRMVRKEGPPIDVSMNFSALKDPSENMERTICIIDDITDRKQAEQEKQNLQVQLLQAQKMEAIGTLAGGIAHDFNNVLWSMGSSQVMGGPSLWRAKRGRGQLFMCFCPNARRKRFNPEPRNPGRFPRELRESFLWMMKRPLWIWGKACWKESDIKSWLEQAASTHLRYSGSNRKDSIS